MGACDDVGVMLKVGGMEELGASVGTVDGSDDGDSVGLSVGMIVGVELIGRPVGESDGRSVVGIAVSCSMDGLRLGADEDGCFVVGGNENG